ncbi:hypothetical protein [Pseudoalteromonas rubra]|uniref:Uncharacterized protein n=1 Tax=Pseudoalteromonas rubra TaxID=43658 RepID=A0A5S3X4U8_9GAMM|nr:hypothetical protein [Pseudoalteromonas rubra]TMP38967.1 hypothetical protein CWB98_04590 [Pseudoalteromonas rubra]
MEEIISISATILCSLGGGAVIIFGLSNFLGKVWADRLMSNEKAKHAQELEAVRSKFQRESHQSLAFLQSEIDILREAKLREYNDKLVIYRAAMDLVATILAKLEMTVLEGRKFSETDKEQFQIDRLKIYAYLAMVANQEIMDENDKFTDLMIEILFEGRESSWEELRMIALGLVNAMRKDIGIDKSTVSYNGER